MPNSHARRLPLAQAGGSRGEHPQALLGNREGPHLLEHSRTASCSLTATSSSRGPDSWLSQWSSQADIRGDNGQEGSRGASLPVRPACASSRALEGEALTVRRHAAHVIMMTGRSNGG
jgi:hypothetical protein